MGTSPHQITLRPTTGDDQKIVVQLLRELVDELGPTDTALSVKAKLNDDIRLALGSASVHIILATTQNKAIGLARGDILTQDPIFRLRNDHRCGYVDQMYVRPDHRGHGLGARLLQHIEQWFRTQGLQHCILHAAPNAVSFYSRGGYQPNREMFKRL